MAYLFVHFTSGEKDSESIYFSVSKDGLNFTDLGGNQPILKAELGSKGIRDPYMVFDEKLGKYFIIATDLNTSDGNWERAANRGSRSLFVWESEDLINWSKERLIEAGIEGAGCVWAPEAVYCKEEGAWFVFWASNVKESGEDAPKQRIYGSFTKDFKEFTPAFKYIEKDTHVIDTDIVWEDGYYYRFSKDETNKVILLERSADLVKGPYEKVESKTLSELKGVEGPEAYYLEEQKKWCLIVDQFQTNGGYLPLVCDKLESGDFQKLTADQYNLGKRKKRHGGVIAITDKQYDALTEAFGRNIRISVYNDWDHVDKAASEGKGNVVLAWDGEYRKGDIIEFSGMIPGKYYVVKVDAAIDPALVLVQQETVTFTVPFYEKKTSYNPIAFFGNRHYVSIREAADYEINAYRNLALNPFDQHEVSGVYPHASANVETRGEAVFAARNAIDGCIATLSHGEWPYESWGINRQDDAEFTLDFGTEVDFDKIVLYTRADFPHDNWWTQAEFSFSDGSSQVVHMDKKVAEPHVFDIKKSGISWIKLGKLIKADDPSPFPALTQIEVYGTVHA